MYVQLAVYVCVPWHVCVHVQCPWMQSWAHKRELELLPRSATPSVMLPGPGGCQVSWTMCVALRAGPTCHRLTSSTSSSGVTGARSVLSVVHDVSDKVSESTDSSSNPKNVSTTCFCKKQGEWGRSGAPSPFPTLVPVGIPGSWGPPGGVVETAEKWFVHSIGALGSRFVASHSAPLA